MGQNIKELPRLSFGEAIKKNLNSLTDFNGRSRRSELWWNWLIYAIISVVLRTFLGSYPLLLDIVSTVVMFGLLSAVTVRRLHDRGQNGLFVAASFVLSVISTIYANMSGLYDIANTINPNKEKIIEISTQPGIITITLLLIIVNITILVFSLMDSKKEENKYGISPKYVTEQNAWKMAQ